MSSLRHSIRTRKGAASMVLVAAIASPLIWANPFWLNVLTLSSIFAIAAMGLTLLFGYADQISFGHAAFIGIGAYISALTTLHMGIPVWLAVISATAGSWLVGYILARPILRLHGLTLAMATLALGLGFFVLFREVRMTGGPNGLPGIVPLSLGPISLTSRPALYLAIVVVAGVVYYWSNRIIKSPTGRALRGLGSQQQAAQAVGIDTAALKSRIFAYSAALAGLSGALYAHYTTFISSETFGLVLSIELVIMVVIGGLTSLLGAVIGALVVTVVPAYLGGYAEYSAILFGAVLVIAFMYFRTGVVGVAQSTSRYAQRLAEKAGGWRRLSAGGG